MQAYIDFFYLTSETTPAYIDVSERLMKEYQLNKRAKKRFEKTEHALIELSNKLIDGETYMREQKGKDCYRTYSDLARQFEALDDWETASYFYKRILETSMDFKYTEGEALAYRGLGICEEKVLNKFQAKDHLEKAHQLAHENKHQGISREISRDLVRVYQQIAIEYQEASSFELALEFFEKCLQVSVMAQDHEKEAECYQQIGQIHEQQGDLDKAIEQLNEFLKICKQHDNNKKEGYAHKLLAEVHSKNGNTGKAIDHLKEVMTIATKYQNNSALAEATLKLGLLYNKEGKERNIKQAELVLKEHFDLLR